MLVARPNYINNHKHQKCMNPKLVWFQLVNSIFSHFPTFLGGDKQQENQCGSPSQLCGYVYCKRQQTLWHRQFDKSLHVWWFILFNNQGILTSAGLPSPRQHGLIPKGWIWWIEDAACVVWMALLRTIWPVSHHLTHISSSASSIQAGGKTSQSANETLPTDGKSSSSQSSPGASLALVLPSVL